MTGPEGQAAAEGRKKSVLVLYNHVGEDWYEKLKHIDPSVLDFEPEYPIDVATVEEECKEIARALRRAGYRTRVVNLEDDLRRLERVLKRNRPDVIFNLVEQFHDDPGLEAAVAAMFELYRIPYTGSPPFALELCVDKGLTKQVLLANGVPTPRFKLLHEPKVPARLGLHYPLIVKPTWEDASAGVHASSVVHSEEQLAERLSPLFEEFDQPILVEEFIDGPELHVSVWGNDPPEVLPPLAYDFSSLPDDYPPIISYAAKWNPLDEIYHRVHTICPAPLPKRTLRRVERAAIRAYETTGCRDYARIDIRLKDGKPYVLEVNPNPDLTEGVSFMESAEQAGHSFSQALARIVELAAQRKPAADAPLKRTPEPVPELLMRLGLHPAPGADPAPGAADSAAPPATEGGTPPAGRPEAGEPPDPGA